MCPQQPNLFTRRVFLRAAAGTVAAAATAGSLRSSGAAEPETSSSAPPGSDSGADIDSLLGELDEKVQAAMQEYDIPGVALGLLYQGTGYIRGYGVTNVDYPVPVDGDTLFRIGSTTKTFTGTAVMRLVEQGKLDLDAPVQTYLPDFATSDPSVARRVTLRQLLNHSPGWLGEYYEDMGPGDDALARYVAGMAQLPQLTPLGEVFAYNNAAIVLAARVIEVATGSTYQDAVRELVLDPLGLSHSRFFSDEIVGFNVAASHNIVDGEPVVDTSLWAVPRTLQPTGGLISSVRDQLAYAAFHLGDGRAPDGTRLLTNESLVAMRSNPGPGGTLPVEIEGVGVNWILRPSAEGVRIVQWGGNWPGQHSGFVMVPERGFALTVLTNSEGGTKLTDELFTDDWALRRFAGVSNLPAEPRALTEPELAPYEGRYTGLTVDPPGAAVPGDAVTVTTEIELKGDSGRLRMTMRQVPAVFSDPAYVAKTEESPAVEFGLPFYRDEYVLVYDESGEPTFDRADFLRGTDGGVEWLRFHGRLYRHQGVSGSLPETGGPDLVGDLLGRLLRRPL